MSETNGHGDTDLVPSNLLSTIETLTPEVLPELPRLVDQRIWNDQQAFLAFYVEYGTKQKACELAGMHRDSVLRWTQENRYGFADRFEQAKQARREYAEQKYILHRLENPKGNYGTDVAAIAYMNRIDPENWNRNLKLVHDVPNELIQQLRALQQHGSQAALEEGENKDRVIDGKSKPLPWED